MPGTDRFRSALADRYSIERELGSGGMATVYLARDLKHDREVALKVLRADLSAMIGGERFLSEVRIAAKLDHPHILTLIDSGSADGILYYVLPYVRGESLRAKLDREKQLAVEDALSIVTQIASALDYAHAQGVVHRDIKPENILLHEGEAVLADFGIALALKEASGNRLTETGLSLGTPQYMSPEQATGDRTLDRRSDVYSLGAVFYEMISGEPPVSGATAQAVVAKLLTEKPVKLRVVRDTVPVAMERATERALAKVPADRFASAGEFARALTLATPEAERAPVRSRMFWPAVGLAALVIIATGLWIARGKSAGTARAPVTLRDRTQITNTGRISFPAISGDGKTIAYVVTDCGAQGCRYGVEMQDVAGGPSRRLLDGATAIYRLIISPDRRNILVFASIKGVYGGFIISTLGGSPRRVVTGSAAFYAGGDSLLFSQGSIPAKTLWIMVSGLDGVPSDSIRVEGPANQIAAITAVPNSQRIMYQLIAGRDFEWISSDRTGARHATRVFSRGYVVQGSGKATSDALWIQTTSPSARERSSIVRIPFDPATGRLADRGDTVYTGAQTAYGVTDDGGTFVVDEGITDYAVWALPLEDALRGRFEDTKRILRATTAPLMGLSRDGRIITLTNDAGSATREGLQWTVMRLDRGVVSAIAGRHLLLWPLDSATLKVLDRTPSGLRLSLLDFGTRTSSALLSIRDSTIEDFTRVPDQHAWVWIPGGRRTINIQRDGDSRARQIDIPSSYATVFEVNGPPNGGDVAFLGWSAPTEDSLGLGLLSLPEGRFTQIAWLFAEGGGLRWLTGGSLALSLEAAKSSVALYRARPGAPLERLGSIPRSVSNFTVSSDMKRAAVVTRDYHGDAWMSKVIR